MKRPHIAMIYACDLQAFNSPLRGTPEVGSIRPKLRGRGAWGFTEQLPDRTVSGNDKSLADKCCEVDPENGFQLNPRVAYTTLRPLIIKCVKHVISPPRVEEQCPDAGRDSRRRHGRFGVRCRVDRTPLLNRNSDKRGRLSHGTAD